MKKSLSLFLSIYIFISFLNISSVYSAQLPNDWYMVGANPQRTSWVATSAENQTEIKSSVKPEWYRVIDPYVNQKYQLIASNDTIFVTTAGGLYALSTNDIDNNGVGGDIRWVYPTEIPLGHSPTVINNIVYIPGQDHKIHAVELVIDNSSLPTDSATGYKINNKVKWIFEALPILEQDGSYTLGGGFETNPLVINNTVYAGNRNGYLYALDSNTGNLKWKFKTGGPVLFSPAASKDSNTIYFGSNDAYAYAVNSQTGSLVWKSVKLPTAGFFAYWPVVYTHQPGTAQEKEYVIFAGFPAYSINYFAPTLRFAIFEAQTSALFGDIPVGEYIGSTGNEPGLWSSGTTTVDASKIIEYYEKPSAEENTTDPIGKNRTLHKPWRRSYFVLDSSNGVELTIDHDNDGQPGYAPIAYTGTKSSNIYPPVLGGDGVLYQMNGLKSRSYIPSGAVMGWKFGTKYISSVTNAWGGWDEPEGYSSGGGVLYTNHNGDVFAESINLKSPYPYTKYSVYSNTSLTRDAPGYDEKYSSFAEGRYGGLNGVYSAAGIRTGNTPYKGKIYALVQNSVIAFSPNSTSSVKLPKANVVKIKSIAPKSSLENLNQKLSAEVQKIIAAGHLKAGYHSSGLADLEYANANSNYLIHYFHRPADTFSTLIKALPHLPTTPVNIQQQTKDYLVSEFTNYGYSTYVGYKNGSQREAFDIPPEIYDAMGNIDVNPYYSPSSYSADYMYRMYGLYLYAKQFGNALTIYNNIKSNLVAPPADSVLTLNLPVFNSYIAGYIGYLEIQKLAGVPESITARDTLNRLLALRASSFTKDLGLGWEQPYNISYNFINMVPELADYLNSSALNKVTSALDEYQIVGPYWFINKFNSTLGEGGVQQLYDVPSIFQAKAYILKEPREELVKYIDVPAFKVGDLFYIQNLVAAIEAPSSGTPTPTVSPSPTPNPSINPIFDVNSDGKVNLIDVIAVLNEIFK